MVIQKVWKELPIKWSRPQAQKGSEKGIGSKFEDWWQIIFLKLYNIFNSIYDYPGVLYFDKIDRLAQNPLGYKIFILLLVIILNIKLLIYVATFMNSNFEISCWQIK